MESNNVSLEAEYHWKALQEMISQAEVTIQRFRNYGAVIQNPMPVGEVEYDKFKKGTTEIIEDLKTYPQVFQNWVKETSSFIEKNLLEKSGRGGTADAPA